MAETAAAAVNFNATDSDKVTSPSKLAHVVLRTNTSNFQAMITFYKTFLGATITAENAMLAFLTYDDEHHRIAILGLPDTKPKQQTTCGLEHIAFTFDTLTDLLLAYRQRKNRGIEPVWSVNHGPTTSIYYKDPDGNMLETQVDNFETLKQAAEFMESGAFEENPIGTDFDPEDLIRQLEAGGEEKELKVRKEMGPRGVPDFI